MTFRGDLQQSIQLCHRALELLPTEDAVFRGFAVRNMGAIYRLNGDVKSTIKAFEEAVRLGQRTHDPIGTAAAMNCLAETYVVRGQLHASKALYEKALEIAADGKGRRFPVAVKVLVGLADLNRQWNNLELGTQLAWEAIDLGRSWIEVWAMGAFIPLARIRQALGDSSSAREAMQEAERLAVEYDATDIDDIAVAAFQARLWVAQGNINAAERWAEERDLDAESARCGLTGPARSATPYYVREIEYISLARLYIAQKRTKDALVVLQSLGNAAEKLGRTGIVTEILVLKTLALSLQRKTDQALEALGRAISLAEPERYVRLFVDEGTELIPLLRRVAARGIAPRYVNELLAVFTDSAARRAGSALFSCETQELVEPLSKREMDVLRLLNTHLTSTHMANELFVAVSTVRSHIKSIYGKLDVHSREEAVQCAQELGLL